MKQSLYEVLGVPPDASRQEIDAAFQVFADSYRPEQKGDDGVVETHYRLAKEARDILSNPQRRLRYDIWLKAMQQPVGVADSVVYDAVTEWRRAMWLAIVVASLTLGTGWALLR